MQRYFLLQNPELACQAGYFSSLEDYAAAKKPVLQDVSAAAYRTRGQHSRAMLQELDIIERSHALNKEDTTFAKLFRAMHSDLARAIEECPLYYMPLNSMCATGVGYSFLEAVDWMRFESKVNYN